MGREKSMLDKARARHALPSPVEVKAVDEKRRCFSAYLRKAGLRVKA
ncbi:hypothetical protein QO005_003380 [Rhizobium paknamense]|uniref:Uncharacterized protein n=1 Tax=Rhizobium paknamense TaxID=1206817 RepID=A0ABU0IFK1_9HYPH|nr:hypothetical protein [Rhizobium paknamense]